MSQHLSLSCTVTLTPLRAGLCAGRADAVDVLVRIQAPDTPAGHAAARPPQALALVIDRSGSMAGQPLAEARRCAAYVVDRLRPTDTISLVQFDHRVQRLCLAAELRDGSAVRAAIACIQSGGNTDLHGGWADGVDSLKQVAGAGLKRVVVLSDGQANAGLTDTDAIAARCAAWAAEGITTSTYGLGGHFNEDLMVAMARAGGGNHYYGETAEDLMDPFQQELELLGNLCLRELRIAASVPDGATVEMVNQLPPAAAGGWRLPDLAWGAEAWAVLRVKVPLESMPPAGGMLTLLRVSVAGRSLDGEAVELERTGLALPVMDARACAALAADGLVQRRLVELAAADALGRMRTSAGAHDWVEVDRLLDAATAQFKDNPWVAAMLEAMKRIARSRSRERMMKESIYSSAKLRDRLVSKEEGASFSAVQESAEIPAYLRRKAQQGKGDA